MRKLIAVLILSLAASTAWAIDIGAAKSQGLVGEANNGNLAAVE